MTTPYDTLGVPKDATKADIKKAYRGKAKRLHPDAGGDPVKFGQLTKAYDVLSDDERRKKYDTTGDDSVDPDTSEAKAMNLIATALGAVLQACAKEGRKPESVALVSVMLDTLKKVVAQADQMERDQKNGMKMLERLIGKFKHRKRKSDPLMDQILRGQIAGMQQAVDLHKRQCEYEAHKRAIEILSDGWTFDPERPEPTVWFSNVSTTTNW